MGLRSTLFFRSTLVRDHSDPVTNDDLRAGGKSKCAEPVDDTEVDGRVVEPPPPVPCAFVNKDVELGDEDPDPGECEPSYPFARWSLSCLDVFRRPESG